MGHSGQVGHVELLGQTGHVISACVVHSEQTGHVTSACVVYSGQVGQVGHVELSLNGGQVV